MKYLISENTFNKYYQHPEKGCCKESFGTPEHVEPVENKEKDDHRDDAKTYNPGNLPGRYYIGNVLKERHSSGGNEVKNRESGCRKHDAQDKT